MSLPTRRLPRTPQPHRLVCPLLAGFALLAIAERRAMSQITLDTSVPTSGEVRFETETLGTPLSGASTFSGGAPGGDPTRLLDELTGVGLNYPKLAGGAPTLVPGSDVAGVLPAPTTPVNFLRSVAAPSGAFGGGNLGVGILYPAPMAGGIQTGGLLFSGPVPAAVTDAGVPGISSVGVATGKVNFFSFGSQPLNFALAFTYLVTTPPGGTAQLSLVSNVFHPEPDNGSSSLRMGYIDAAVSPALGPAVRLFQGDYDSTNPRSAVALGPGVTMITGFLPLLPVTPPSGNWEITVNGTLTVGLDPGAQARPGPLSVDLAQRSLSSSGYVIGAMDPTHVSHWTDAGPGHNDWANPNNWYAGKVPGPHDDAVFDDAGIENDNGIVGISGTAMAHSLLFMTSMNSKALNPGPDSYQLSSEMAALVLGDGTGPTSIESWTGKPVQINAPIQVNSDTLVLRTADHTATMTIDGKITSMGGGAVTLETDGLGRTILNNPTSQIATLRVHHGTTEVPNGTLPGMTDIMGGALEINYGTGASPEQAIRFLLNAAYANGKWNAGPITSSTAGADPAHLTLGYADGADGVASKLPAGYERIMFTHPGDVNLDGKVDFTDLLILARHYGMQNAKWDQGDFDYDGMVDFNDLKALARNYNASFDPAALAQFSPAFRADVMAAFAAVPEPNTSATLIAVCPWLLSRRCRLSKSSAGK